MGSYVGDDKTSTSTQLCVLDQDLSRKVALVTGASRGIGYATALHLAARGASILGTCSSPQSLHQIESLSAAVDGLYQSSSPKRPVVVGVVANLLSPNFAEAVVDKIRDVYDGKLHIIVNNASVAGWREFGELDARYVHGMLLGNIQNLVLLTDLLIKKGYIRQLSRVVDISGGVTRSLPFTLSGMALYAATKSAMESLTRSWADFFASDERTRGTTMNSLVVGPTASESFLKNGAPEWRAKADESRLGNGKSAHNGVGWPDDIADVVGLIVNERAHWITSSVVCANGSLYKIL